MKLHLLYVIKDEGVMLREYTSPVLQEVLIQRQELIRQEVWHEEFSDHFMLWWILWLEGLYFERNFLRGFPRHFLGEQWSMYPWTSSSPHSDAVTHHHNSIAQHLFLIISLTSFKSTFSNALSSREICCSTCSESGIQGFTSLWKMSLRWDRHEDSSSICFSQDILFVHYLVRTLIRSRNWVGVFLFPLISKTLSVIVKTE